MEKKHQTSGKKMNKIYNLIKPKRYLMKLFKKPHRTTGPLVPTKRFANKYEILNDCVDGNEILTARHSKSSHQHLIYLHGGAYILGKDGMKKREGLLGKIIDHTHVKVTFFDYPVAPEAQYKETLEGVLSSYKYLIDHYPTDEFILCGDSAGGGLALAFAQMIKDMPIKQPTKMTLFSPWLDLSMTNPGISEFIDTDMLLSLDALKYASHLYVGSDDLKNPLASPLYGDFKGLCKTQLFFGTYELLYPDGLYLKALSQEKQYDMQFHFYEEMQHVWVIAPMLETNQALEEVYDFILNA